MFSLRNINISDSMPLKVRAGGRADNAPRANARSRVLALPPLSKIRKGPQNNSTKDTVLKLTPYGSAI